MISGVLLGFAFPPFESGYLAFVALIPLLFSIEYLISSSSKRTYLLLYACYFLFQGIANWWVGSWQKESDPFLIASGVALQIGHPFFLMIPILAYIYIRKRLTLNIALITLPFLYISYEWLHSLTDASYPWLSLGYMLISVKSISQCADIIGVFGLTFIIVILNVLFFKFLLLLQQRKSKYSILSLGLFILSLFLMLSIYGNMRIKEINEIIKQSDNITVGIVQPNINPWKKWSGGVSGQISKHFTLMQSSQHQELDLWIWSETAVPFFDISANINHNFSAFLNISNSVPILTGFAELQLLPNNTSEPLAKPFALRPEYSYIAYNAAALISRNHATKIHRKMKLTPFGEGVPFSQDIPWLGGLLEWGVGISGWKKGAIQKPLNMVTNNGTSVSIGTIICIESIYPEYVSHYGKEQATMLSVITNDAWFDGSPGPMQHFSISQMRAIENRKSIARCGNTGVSGIIYPDGSIADIAAPEQEAVLIGNVPQMNIFTLYSDFGDVLPRIACFVSLGMLVISGYMFATSHKKVAA